MTVVAGQTLGQSTAFSLKVLTGPVAQVIGLAPWHLGLAETMAGLFWALMGT